MNDMESLNKVELQGKIGRINVTDISGTKMARMAVATTYAYQDKGGCQICETTWHNVVAWESENCKDLDKLAKGDNVRVEGRIRNQRYVDAEGNDRISTEIMARKVEKM